MYTDKQIRGFSHKSLKQIVKELHCGYNAIADYMTIVRNRELTNKDITSEHLSIRKDEWNCVISHKESYIIPSVKIMIPTTEDICDRYERNK